MSKIVGNMAGCYSPLGKTFILQDADGNEFATGVVTDQEKVFDATPNDVRINKTFVANEGAKTGEKVIPAYHTTQGSRLITSGSAVEIKLPYLNAYDYTKFQAIICEFNTNINDSVSATKVSIDNNVYDVLSTVVLSEVNKNDTDQTIELGIENTSGKHYLLRFFTYKEI